MTVVKKYCRKFVQYTGGSGKGVSNVSMSAEPIWNSKDIGLESFRRSVTMMSNHMKYSWEVNQLMLENDTHLVANSIENLNKLLSKFPKEKNKD